MGSAAEPRRPASGRIDSLDVLKGLAALWVLMIHAEAMATHPAMVFVFNRAAPLFVILIGVNGEMWWRGRAKSTTPQWSNAWAWWRNRFWRLYPPVWLTLPVWWGLAFSVPPYRHIPLSAELLVKHLAGYLVGIGTGWFVSLAISVAVLFPVLHLAARRFGAGPVLVLGIVSTAVSFAWRFTLIGSLGVFGWFTFTPRLLAHVAFGIWLAPRVARLDRRVVLGAAAVTVAYFIVPGLLGTASPWQLAGGEGFSTSDGTAIANRLMDLPVCVLLLAACRVVERAEMVARPLRWLGNESYGIYLGQMLTHNACTMLLGLTYVQESIDPWIYVGILLVGAVAWVYLSNAALRLLRVSPPRAAAPSSPG